MPSVDSLLYVDVVKRRRLAGEDLERHLRANADAIARAFSAVRIVLFGSFARGDRNRGSDIDLIVIAETELPFCDRIGLALAACHAVSTEVPVEILVYTPTEWEAMNRRGSSFAGVVQREGRILYDRESQSERSAALVEASSS